MKTNDRAKSMLQHLLKMGAAALAFSAISSALPRAQDWPKAKHQVCGALYCR
jgi:hypothetical protein